MTRRNLGEYKRTSPTQKRRQRPHRRPKQVVMSPKRVIHPLMGVNRANPMPMRRPLDSPVSVKSGMQPMTMGLSFLSPSARRSNGSLLRTSSRPSKPMTKSDGVHSGPRSMPRSKKYPRPRKLTGACCCGATWSVPLRSATPHGHVRTVDTFTRGCTCPVIPERGAARSWSRSTPAVRRWGITRCFFTRSN